MTSKANKSNKSNKSTQVSTESTENTQESKEMTTALFTTLVPETILSLVDALGNAKKFKPNYKGGISLGNAMLQHERFADAVKHMNGCIAGLGVDAESIGYIVDVSNPLDEKTQKTTCKSYTPSIKGRPNGDAMLVWGSSQTLLSDMKKKGISITFAGDKYPNACLEFTHDDVEYFIEVPLRTPQGSTLKWQQAKQAFSRNELGWLLQYRPANVTEINAGLYSIIDIKVASTFKGASKHAMLLKGEKVWYSAPNLVQEKINSVTTKDYPTESNPWSLNLGEVETRTFEAGREITFRKVLRITTGTITDINLDDFILDEPKTPTSNYVEPEYTGEQNSILDGLAADFEVE